MDERGDIFIEELPPHAPDLDPEELCHGHVKQQLRNVQKAIHVEHGLTDVQNSVFFGVPIKHAFVVTSRREAA